MSPDVPPSIGDISWEVGSSRDIAWGEGEGGIIRSGWDRGGGSVSRCATLHWGHILGGGVLTGYGLWEGIMMSHGT